MHRRYRLLPEAPVSIVRGPRGLAIRPDFTTTCRQNSKSTESDGSGAGAPLIHIFDQQVVSRFRNQSRRNVPARARVARRSQTRECGAHISGVVQIHFADVIVGSGLDAASISFMNRANELGVLARVSGVDSPNPGYHRKPECAPPHRPPLKSCRGRVHQGHLLAIRAKERDGRCARLRQFEWARGRMTGSTLACSIHASAASIPFASLRPAESVSRCGPCRRKTFSTSACLGE